MATTDTEGLRIIAYVLEGGNMAMANECRRAADEVDHLRAVVEAVDALHWKTDATQPWCWSCEEPWPCSTHLAIRPEAAS